MNLDRRAQFRRATLVDNGLEQVEVFANHGSPVPVAKRDVSDGERSRASEVQAIITARFQLRWSAFSAGLTPKDRLVCEGREYDITGIKEIQRRRVLEISASARADQ